MRINLEPFEPDSLLGGKLRAGKEDLLPDLFGNNPAPAPEPSAGVGEPLLLEVDLIDEDPLQPRTEFADEPLRELAASIAERGVLQAISVRRHPKHPGRWLVNFGARRLRASKLVGRTQIPAYVNETPDSYDQVIENEQREGLKPLELALFIQRRIALGESQAEIAHRMGKSRPYITYATALIDAPDWLMKVYREGRCRGLLELYELRQARVGLGTQVEAWAAAQPSITRRELAALKTPKAPLDVRQHADQVAGAYGPRPAPAIAAAPAQDPPTGITVLPSAQTQAQVVRSAVAPRPRLVVEGEFEGQVVELVLDRLPADASQVFVRDQDGAAVRPVAIDSVVLGRVARR